MMFVKKAQVMILDVLIFIIIILLVISIQITIIKNYKENISFQEKKIKLIEKEVLIDNYLLDCEALGYKDIQTNKCYLNKVSLINLKTVPDYFCKVKINENTLVDKKKEITTTHRRAVVYNNQFSIMEVSFCEQ